MVSSQTYSVSFPPSDGRRFTRSYHTPYSYLPDRRFLSHHHEQRVMTMADSEVENDPSQQRKRISVACGRCRKRKIRCSGDPGGGQPCSNCKNAGSEPCLFLRVSSSEAAFRSDPNEFSYNIEAAKHARHIHVAPGMGYPPTHDLPPVPSHEILSPYRSGSAYGYATKPFYSGLPAYSMGYVEEIPDYSTQPVLGQDMVSYPSWTTSRAGDYGGYGATTNLVHRPAPSVSVDSANFSLSSMAAHLPGPPSVGSTDRLLPAPSSRSMSYSASQSYKALPPAGGHLSDQSVDAAAVLADMASSSYGGGSFDASGLPYNSSTTSLHHAHAHNTTHNSRANSDTNYSPVDTADSIFSEHEHSLRSQGSAVDLHGYTYSADSSSAAGPSSSSVLRRGSAAALATGTSPTAAVSASSSSNGGSTTATHRGSTSTISTSSGGYIAAIHDSSSASTHHHQHGHHGHHHHGVPLASVVSGTTAPPPVAYLATGGGEGSVGGGPGGGRVHGDTRRAAVGGRR